jgi:hypothetical protein
MWYPAISTPAAAAPTHTSTGANGLIHWRLDRGRGGGKAGATVTATQGRKFLTHNNPQRTASRRCVLLRLECHSHAMPPNPALFLRGKSALYTEEMRYISASFRSVNAAEIQACRPPIAHRTTQQHPTSAVSRALRGSPWCRSAPKIAADLRQLIATPLLW